MLQAIGRNTLMQLAGKGLSTVLGLIIVSLMTRALGQTGFGQYTSAVAFLQFFGILVDFGLTMTLARELGQQKYDEQTLVSNLFSFRVTTATVAFIIAPVAALFLPYSPVVRLGITITSLAFWASTIGQCFSGVFQSRLATGRLVLSELVGRFVLLAGTWWAVLQTNNITNYFIILTLASLTTAILTLWSAHRLINLRWQISWPVWQYLWQSTWPVAVTIALNLIYFKADTVILSWLKSEAEVGLYGAAYKVLEVLLAIPAIIGGLILPLAAQANATNDKTKLANIYQGTFDSLLAAGLGIVVGGLIIGVDLMVWLAGNNFAASGKILMILSLATAFIFIGNAGGYIIFALDKQKQMIPYYLAAALVGLVGYIIFIPSYSYWGAAWMTVIVEGFMALTCLIILWRYGLKPNPSRWGKILLATLIMAVGLILPVGLIIKIIIALLLYGLATWQLKLLPSSNKAPVS